ncbi:SusC/RagA family TonB-linked outer membrane protein [Siphonobacter aquaeclarae]|jgi:TonB-linked SusC/RagA family outer membrane protein|uniref:TonB-linked outer membrane protein, SusC/RagA family n=1 Tax=Siphonobacter aquaeclarae TaxID=563176 RepID=A0A1G9UCC6_9BACT|nr:SusC/RagA family TonB-linked outer membrane protein [Siphonobacter aquaeclarae]SDM57617.1 TonB-linked outer membrane protein, SusC/RagA family [Siphonobacter aquaeclarae]
MKQLLQAGICMLLLCVSGFLFPGYAQQRTLSGKVLSAEDSQPLAGVAVRVKNTNRGVNTDADGRYRLTILSDKDIVVFTFVGHEPAEEVVGNRTELSVSLKTDHKLLNEVVVTSLGIQKAKRDLSYATQSIKAQDLIKAREPNPVNALVGKIAGLNIGASAELLRAPQVLLRGGRPLFVVDGVPIISDTYNINPDDIESYDVIKGPSGSALYGSRAVNGVIIITTKKGSRDKRGVSVEVNSSTMVEQGFLAIPKVQDLYGPGDHGTYSFVDGRGGGKNDGDYDIWGPKFEGQLIPQYDSPVDPATGIRKGTPWIARGKDNLTRFLRPGILSTNSVSVSSSSEKTDLRFGVTNQYQQGMIPNTQLNSTTFSATLGQNLSDKVRFESNFNFSRQASANYPDVNYGPNSLIYNMVIWGGADWNVDDMKQLWQPGKEGIQQIYAEYQRYNNPWFVAKEWKRGHYNNSYNGYALMKFRLRDDLELQARTQVTGYELFRNEKMPYSATTYGREQAKGDYREDRRSLLENNTDVLLNYNKTFRNEISVRAVAGLSGRFFRYNGNYASTDYLNVPGVYSFDNSLNAVRANSFNSQMQVLSALYSVDVNLGKYATVSTTGRWDKNSTLPSSKNVFFYPSAGVSSVISDFVPMPQAISFVKLRASYANVKDAFTQQNIYTAFSALSGGNPLGYGQTFASPYDGPSYGTTVAYTISRPYNNEVAASYSNSLLDPNLKPSSRTSFEAGLDIRFLKNRIGLDVSYFSYLDGPRIFGLTLPEATGYTSLTTNGIKSQRRGLEIALTGTALKSARGLNWDVTVNWSTFQEYLKEIYGNQARLNQFYKIGDRLDAYYGSAFYRTKEGQIINDASGRPIVNAVSQFLGNTNADFAFGFINKFSYRNFFLNVQIDGRVGGVIEDYIQKQTFRGGRHIETVEGKMGDARFQDYKGVKSWVGPGVVLTEGSIQPDVDGKITNYDKLSFTPMSDKYKTYLQDWISRYYNTNEANIISRSFVKLREVTFGYQVPSRLLTGRMSFLKGASVSFVARNLLYFAAKKDLDVEQFVNYSNTSSDLQTPTTRRYGVNINLTF